MKYLKDLTGIDHVRIIFTSRKEECEWIDIRLPEIFHQRAIKSDKTDDDIRVYIDKLLQEDPEFAKRSDEIKKKISERLTDGAQGMFRWVYCQVDSLRGCRTSKQIDDALDNLPETLYDTYEKILQNVPEKDKDFLRRGLAWIMWHKYEELDEIKKLAEAMALEPDSEALDLDVDFVKQVPGICGCLVRFERKDLSYDDERTTYWEIPLAHYSVQEFLISERANSFAMKEDHGNRLILHACLTYLQLSDFSNDNVFGEDSSMNDYDDYTKIFEKFRLYEYCAYRWHKHVNSADDQLFVLSKAAVLFQHKPVSAQFRVLMDYLSISLEYENLARAPRIPLRYISKFDLPFVAKGLIEQELQQLHSEVPSLYQADVPCPTYATNGSSRIGCQSLFDCDTSGRMPIHLAAENGNFQIVEVLQAAMGGLNIDIQDNEGWTPLHCCVESTYADASRLKMTALVLLQQGADPNHVNKIGRSILSNATENFDIDMFTLLLKNGADPYQKLDPSGRTVIQYLYPSRDLGYPQMWHRKKHVLRSFEFLMGLQDLGIDINSVQPPVTELEYHMVMMGAKNSKLCLSPMTSKSHIESTHLTMSLALLHSCKSFHEGFGGKGSHSPFTYAVCRGYNELIKKMIRLGARFDSPCIEEQYWMPSRGHHGLVTPLNHAMLHFVFCASRKKTELATAAKQTIRYCFERGVSTTDIACLSESVYLLICHKGRGSEDMDFRREIISKIAEKMIETSVDLILVIVKRIFDYAASISTQYSMFFGSEFKDSIDLFRFIQGKGFKIPDYESLKDLLSDYTFKQKCVEAMAPLFSDLGLKIAASEPQGDDLFKYIRCKSSSCLNRS